MKLRRAGDADVAALAALQRAAYARNRAILGVEPMPLLADYGDVIATKEVWLAEDSAGLAAALILEVEADHLLIWSIATEPERQHQGLGRQLLAAAEARAAEIGVAVIRLYTGSRLTERVAWYARHGFVVESIEQLSDRSRTNMIKRLSG